MSPSPKQPELWYYPDGVPSALRKATVFSQLRFYQRSEVLYQLTVHFCQRFFPTHGDRTVDQMVQAARSTQQNIAEGCSDGQTSAESELKLLGIARGSNQELLGDYQNYLKRKDLAEWFGQHPRFDKMHTFCKEHTHYDDYRDLLPKMSDEELANMALCLCHQVDSGLTKYIEKKDREFVTQGGIKERMYASRTGYRQQEQARLKALEQQLPQLQAEIKRLQSLLEQHGIDY